MYKLYIKQGEEKQPAIQGGLHVLTTDVSSQQAIAWLAEAKRQSDLELIWEKLKKITVIQNEIFQPTPTSCKHCRRESYSTLS
jgi:hypothetical protein